MRSSALDLFSTSASFLSHRSRRLPVATGLATWLLAVGFAHAEERIVTLSRFGSPADSGRLIYAYPAVTVESSVWGENFSGSPTLRSMPTAVTVQSSMWATEAPPAPAPRTETTTAARETTPPEPKPKKHHVTPPPAEQPEAQPKKPRKHAEAVEEQEAKPQFHNQPHLREKHEPEQKAVVEKEVVPPAPEKPLIQLSGSAGYYSRYMFRGLDVAYRTGIDRNNESPFVGTNAAISIGDFALGAWYIESLNSYVPGGAGFDKSFGDLNKDTDFRTPPRERYQEYDLFANYTFHLTHNLALTTGMNFYWFSDGRFWAQGNKHVNSTKEAAASLNWTGVPYLNQTLNYYYDFDAFKGGYLEYKAALHPIQLYKNGDFAIGLSPNFSISYDFRYNGTNNGWNNFEPGIDMPIHISDGLSLNVGVKYSWDLGDHSVGAHGAPDVRTDDRLWFSAAFQYNFPIGYSKAETGWSKTEGKGIAAFDTTTQADNGRWRVSAGAGLRTMHANFDVGRAAPYNLGSLFTKKGGGGDLGFGTNGKDAYYEDGTVYSSSSNFGDGTADFTVQNSSQVTDDGRHGNGGIDRQITYHSDRYNYSTSNDRSGFTHGDDDQVVYPYLNLSYDVVKNDRFSASIGLGYQYNHSSMQSGSQLVGLQNATEDHAAHQFIYNIDEIFSDNTPFSTPLNSKTANYYIIYDAGQYNAHYGTPVTGINLSNLGPQHTEVDTRRVVASVASFRSANLDLDMHAVSLPIDLSCKITNRIQARVSFGPTFNIFDDDLSTETDYQLLDQAGAKVTKNDSTRTIYKSPFDSSIGGVGVVGPNGAGTVSRTPTGSTSASATTPGGTATGGKGSVGGVSRKLPGTNLRKDFNRHQGQHFEAGVFGQLAVEVDLDAARRWFLEVYARYDYVPNFTISDGATSTSIDASSWGSGIGLGFRF